MQILTLDELKRYQQQMNVPEIGMQGQLFLKNAKVACVGAGGLGTPLLLYLAAAGIGTLGIIDDDIVEASNLPRQILYNEKDMGKSKAACAAEKLLNQFAVTKINVHQVRLNAENAKDILERYDMVADCSDNFPTRYLLNDVCYLLDKPLVSASIFRFQGQCMTTHGKRGPCLRCLFPKMPAADEFENCEQAGVLNVLPGIFGMMQASEILKYILQRGELLIGKVLTADLLKMQFNEYQLAKNPDCDLCTNQRMMHADYESKTCSKGEKVMRDYIITTFELHDLLKKKAELQLVDVRTSDKHAAYNIGGKNIPTAELQQRLHELDPEKLVITYCTSGGNSMRALQFLLSAGFKSVKSLDGGMTAWKNDQE